MCFFPPNYDFLPVSVYIKNFNKKHNKKINKKRIDFSGKLVNKGYLKTLANGQNSGGQQKQEILSYTAVHFCSISFRQMIFLHDDFSIFRYNNELTQTSFPIIWYHLVCIFLFSRTNQ